MKAALQFHQNRLSRKMLEQEVLPVLDAANCEYEVLGHDHFGNAAVAPDTDFVLVLGGDGTFLAGARVAVQHNLPVLGVMVGRLGFLCQFTMKGLPTVLLQIKQGNLPVEERFILQGEIRSADGKVKASDLAVNDAVLFRHQTDNIRELSAYHNGDLIANYRADGVILSTALGSTAYTLAAGGPLVHPALDAIVLTPICAHSLFTKPLVLPPSGEVVITAPAESYPLITSFDGMRRIDMVYGDCLAVKAHTNRLEVYRPEDQEFYSVLRNKFQHGFLYGNNDA